MHGVATTKAICPQAVCQRERERERDKGRDRYSEQESTNETHGF